MKAITPLHRFAVAGVLLIPLIAYWWTAKPSVDFWDTGELQTVPHILGIAHPTGFPTFILLGWLFTHILPIGNVAWRTTLMCSVAVSVSSVVAYQLGLRLCGSRVAAFFAATFFAGGAIVWTYATRTEVQSLSLLLRVLAIYELIVWRATLERRHLFAGWLVFGLAESTHGIAALSLPGLLLLSVPPRRLQDPAVAVTAVIATAIGLLPYAYLPIRSAVVTHLALDPTTGLGLPEGMPFWDYDHPSTLSGFLRLTTGSDFDVRDGLFGIFDLRQYGTFLRYLVIREWLQFGALCTFALYGIFMQYRRQPDLCVSLLLLALVPVPFINSYRALADPDRARRHHCATRCSAGFASSSIAERIRPAKGRHFGRPIRCRRSARNSAKQYHRGRLELCDAPSVRCVRRAALGWSYRGRRLARAVRGPV